MEEAEQYPIRKNIPYPGKPKINAGRRASYPFNHLQIGDSFFVASKHKNISQEKRLYAALHTARVTLGFNFQWAREPGGFAIYRRRGGAGVKKRAEAEKRV